MATTPATDAKTATPATTPTPPVKINTADLDAQRRRIQAKLAQKKQEEADMKAAAEAASSTGVTAPATWKPTLPADISARQRQQAIEYANRVNAAASGTTKP